MALAILCHAGLDTIFFVTAAAEAAFADTGITPSFVVFSILLVLSGAAAVFVLRKIAAVRAPSG